MQEFDEKLLIPFDNYDFLLNNKIWDEIRNNISTNEDLIKFGIACTQCFIQINFTGPKLSPEIDSAIDQQLSKITERHLLPEERQEDFNVNVKKVVLLSIAKYVVSNCKCPEVNRLWLKLRILYLEQSVLDDLNEGLYKTLQELDILLENVMDLPKRILVRINLEISYCYLLFDFVQKCRKKLDKCRELLGLKIDLHGELGKRTKYQQKEVAQLFVDVITDNECPSLENFTEPNNSELEIVDLDDDLRLNEIAYTNQEHLKQNYNLPLEEQAYLLAHVYVTLKERPQNELEAEEILPFLNYLLKQAKSTFALRFSTLFLRCKLESNHKRTIERTLSQCESLCNVLMKEPSSAEKLFDRCNFFFGSGACSIYVTKILLATTMLNLGLVKAALEIFMQLEQWEDVIVCFTILEQRHRAAEVIRKRIKAEGPTVKYLCLLGDATDDVECYEKAWELSEKRSAKAQRHWGLYYYHRKNYTEAVPHLKLSLEINSLQLDVWSRLGYTSLTIEDWENAAWAYRRYTSLNPDSFEAWNNLAKAYIKLGDKKRAHKTLQDALKCNYDNWKVWDNFLAVSASIGEFSDAIRAYHRLLDLKDEKHIDKEVLEVLVMSDIPQNEHLKKLFGRITSASPNEGKIWELYAILAGEDKSLRWQRLQRAYRSYCGANRDWFKEEEMCKRMSHVAKEMAEYCDLNNASEKSSTRMILKAVIAALKKNDFDSTKHFVQDIEKLLENFS